MFFIASKIFWYIFSPLTLIAILLMTGCLLLALKQAKWGRRATGLAIALFVIGGVLPTGPNLIVYLESRYDVPGIPDDVAGFLVLGGAIHVQDETRARQMSIRDHGERFTEMLRLSRAYPQVPIVYSGGDGGLTQSSPKESDIVQNYLKEIGYLNERLRFENRSRSTYENMAYSLELVHPQPGDKWVLITSAFHMPRSAAVFRKGGWNVLPYPAGYLEDGTYKVLGDLDVLGNFYKLQVATKEIVGIIAYKLTGKL